MKLKKYGMLLASLGLLASCSNDNLEGPNQPDLATDGEVYFTLSVKEATGSRGTDDDGTPTPEQTTVNGEDYESAISSVLLIIADPQGNQKVVGKGEQIGQTSSYKFAFTGNKFETLYTLTDVQLYAVCNLAEESLPTTKPSSSSFNIQREMKLESDGDTYWKNNNFLMSNSKAKSFKLNAAEIKSGKYTSDSPYDLGEIRVQRAMARLDLAQAAPTQDEAVDNNIKIEFNGVGLVNLSKSFFLYKEVGKSGNFKLFDDEEEDNFVNDPKASKSTYGDADLFYRVNGTDKLNALYAKKTYEWFKTSTGEYDVLRYLTPNTVIATDQQVNGKSTGLIFRAEIKGASSNLPLDNKDKRNLYVYNKKVVGDLTTLQSKLSSNAELNSLYTSIVGSETNEDQIIAKLRAANVGFEIFPGEKIENETHFFCYYPYWIRHNGVGSANDGNMTTPMEFGVVRNNIYKIKVASVSGLGKPADEVLKTDYPDDPPHNDEEVTSTALKVQIIVEKWEVREDEINF